MLDRVGSRYRPRMRTGRTAKRAQNPTIITRPTQPPTLSGTGNEYRPKCGDALRGWGVKAMDGSFIMIIILFAQINKYEKNSNSGSEQDRKAKRTLTISPFVDKSVGGR